MTPASSLRSRLPEIALEALMVVFAVLVALAVDEWREERQLEQLAARARAAVVSEVRANLEEMRSTGPGYQRLLGAMAPIVREGAPIVSDSLDLTVQLPDFSSAAWSTAQVMQAAPYLEYEWVIEASRAYELVEFYTNFTVRVVETMSGIVAAGPDRDGVTELFGHLVVLNQFHAQLQDRLERLLEREGG